MNHVHKALSELSGVLKVTQDLNKDQLTVRYDPEKVTTQKLLETIATVKVEDVPFKGEIVGGSKGPSPQP